MKNLNLGNYITIKMTKSTSQFNLIHLNDTYIENHCKTPQSYNRSRQGKGTVFVKRKSIYLFKESKSTSSLKSIDLKTKEKPNKP